MQSKNIAKSKQYGCPSKAAICALHHLVDLRLTTGRLAGSAVEAAIKAYDDARYAEALKRFETAAQAGDARAQEVLGFMYLNGGGLRRCHSGGPPARDLLVPESCDATAGSGAAHALCADWPS